MLTGNRLKDRLRAGEMQVGLFGATGSPVAAEILALSGVDWVLVDLEHGFGDSLDLVRALQAIDSAGVDTAVRIPDNDPVIIKRALDAGARTLLVPQVDDAAAAQAAGRAARYPPAGIRGLSSTPRANRYGRRKDYFGEADAEIAVIVQIESAAAIANAHAICAVAEIDGVFIGPGDLAASLGYIGQPQHPEVERAAASAVTAAKEAGKPAGAFTAGPEQMLRYRAWGCSLFALGSDAGLLAAASDAAVARARAELG